jgi:hypothetical protein
MPTYTEHPERRAAQRLVRKAVAIGEIVPAAECSDCHVALSKLQAHHPDYSMPLNVVWLCCVCHRRRHNEAYLAEKRSQRTHEQLSFTFRVRKVYQERFGLGFGNRRVID